MLIYEKNNKMSEHKPGTQDFKKGIPDTGKRSKHSKDVLFPSDKRMDGQTGKFSWVHHSS